LSNHGASETTDEKVFFVQAAFILDNYSWVLKDSHFCSKNNAKQDIREPFKLVDYTL
jgi:hypothetical protein